MFTENFVNPEEKGDYQERENFISDPLSKFINNFYLKLQNQFKILFLSHDF